MTVLMKLLRFGRAAEPLPRDPIDHPALRAMSPRELADLPLGRA